MSAKEEEIEKTEEEIKKEVKKERKEEKKIEKEVYAIKHEVGEIEAKVKKEPYKFSFEDIVESFVGAFTIGITFLFKGALLPISQALTMPKAWAVIFITLVLLAAEIYFIVYRKVTDKKARPVIRFVSKRLVGIYTVSIITSFLLAWIFNIIPHNVNTGEGMFMLLATLGMPTALGAAAVDLFRK
jgi:uncharacterized membrane protein